MFIGRCHYLERSCSDATEEGGVLGIALGRRQCALVREGPIDGVLVLHPLALLQVFNELGLQACTAPVSCFDQAFI